VQWLRDNLGIIRDSAEVEALANTVPDNGDVYFVPAFSGLYAPHWRADARGIIAGLTRFAHRGHIARAVLEATAYQTLDVVRAMEQDSGVRLRELRVDGGMVANETLMRFQADILNVPVARPNTTETTALGAAYAAGLAVGYWAGPEDLRANWAVAARWDPTMTTDRREALLGSWDKAVGRSVGWACHHRRGHSPTARAARRWQRRPQVGRIAMACDFGEETGNRGRNRLRDAECTPGSLTKG